MTDTFAQFDSETGREEIMALKTAIFRNQDPMIFKKDLNDFIANKQIKDIKYNTILTQRGTIIDSALVIYYEKGDKNE